MRWAHVALRWRARESSRPVPLPPPLNLSPPYRGQRELRKSRGFCRSFGPRELAGRPQLLSIGAGSDRGFRLLPLSQVLPIVSAQIAIPRLGLVFEDPSWCKLRLNRAPSSISVIVFGRTGSVSRRHLAVFVPGLAQQGASAQTWENQNRVFQRLTIRAG